MPHNFFNGQTRCRRTLDILIRILAVALGVAIAPFARSVERLLFLDPAIVHEAKGVALRVNPPSRTEAIIHVDRPWEQRMISFYTSVIEEEGRLRMWYICRDADNRPNVAYAESRDGITWTKPNLGLVEYRGSKDNNLVGITSLDE